MGTEHEGELQERWRCERPSCRDLASFERLQRRHFGVKLYVSCFLAFCFHKPDGSGDDCP